MIPKDLHFCREPLTQTKVAQSMAKDNLAQTHPITTPKVFPTWQRGYRPADE